jgi:outer membrane protein TolC
LINLGTALEMAGAENATIARALEAVRASQAEQLQAQALLLPTLDAGLNLDERWGNLQSAQGILRDVDRQALYIGAGAGAIGAGTVAFPGVQLTAQLAEAVFEPIAARQRVLARRFDAAATRDAILLDVVDVYFDLIGLPGGVDRRRRSRRRHRSGQQQQGVRFTRFRPMGRTAHSDRAIQVLCNPELATASGFHTCDDTTRPYQGCQ